MKKSIEVKKENLEAIAPLYRQYDGQTKPQPAYVEIDPRGDSIIVSADYSEEIGNAIPARVWHHLTYQIDCPDGILGESLTEYLESDHFQEQVREMCEGYEERWDGSNNAGHWNQWARQIEEAIESDLRDLEYAQIYEGDEWIDDDVQYLDENGTACPYDDATRAKYGDIEINRENLDDLTANAESYVDHDTVVIGLESAFEDIIERLEENQD